LFRIAEENQRDAWGLFNQRRYALASAASKTAGRRVDMALQLAAFNPEQVRSELRRTQELIDELKPVVIRSGIKHAIELGRMAEKEQETARREFEARHYRLALKFTRAARQHARRAGEIVLKHGGRERLALEIERTGMKLERARELLSTVKDERIDELFRHAEEAQQGAKAAFRAGDWLKSLRLTMSARELLRRGWVMARGEADPELVEQALEDTDRLASDWQEVIRTEGDQDAVGLLETALDRQRQAREHFGEQRYRPAMQETTLAHRLLKRAIELSQSERALPAPGDDGPDED
jgi:hypothetical protein